MRRLAVAVLAALALAPAAVAAPTTPVYDHSGRLVEIPFTPPTSTPRLTKDRAIALFLAEDKVADWLAGYPHKDRVEDASFDADPGHCTAGTGGGCWTVHVWWKQAGEIATGRVDDRTALVTEAWTGPQVAWKMARGGEGAFGGKQINRLPVWLGFSLVFLLGLADLRRPRRLRNLDLLALLSFSASLWFFNHGRVFASSALAVPPLAYVVARCAWIGFRGRPVPGRGVWGPWVLLAATVFLVGFRVGLVVEASNVIDVGYSGVIGADRIAHGQAPYKHFPVEESLKACGPADAEGEIRDRIQTNGRCESANPQGDTYGPVAYEAYLPGYLAFGWDGKWNPTGLPAVKATTILFDLLCLLGLGLVGLRFGGSALGAALPFAWAAFPFTQYASSSNTNDTILPAFLIWGLWLVTSPWARGAAVALSGWTKFAALLLAPLWLSFPGPLRRPRPSLAFVAGFAAATLAGFSILLLEPDPLHAVTVFYQRTIEWQVKRHSPFSIWDWAQYHASGLPDLHVAQRVLQVALVVAALAVAFVPRRKSPLQLAALTGMLIAGFELVLTHWFYLYIPWFFPFVAFALLAGGRAATTEEEPAPRHEVLEIADEPRREPAPA